MTTSGSSIISALGAGSGVDFIKLADDVSAASFGAQRQNVEARRSKLETQISAAAQLRSSLTGLADALGDRLRTGDLAPRAELGNAAVARVSVPSGLSPRGSFALEVTQLAEAQTLVSKTYPDRDARVGEGVLTIRFGNIDGSQFAANATREPVAINVTADDTLASLAAKINVATGGSVRAYASAGVSGAQLVLKGATGASEGFVLEAGTGTTPAAPGELGYLGWNPAGDAGELRARARDANFLLDTVPMTSASNRVTGLPGGFTLELTATNAGAPTNLSFATNSSAITAAMNDFVVALNIIVDQVNELAAPLGGSLGSDPGARMLRRDLAGLAGRVVMPGSAPGEPSSLADLGLVLNRDGTFRLDSARINQALQSTPDAVAAMFTLGASGVFASVGRFARKNSLVSDPGSIGSSLRRFELQLASSDKRLSAIAEQQQALRERLTREFTASERRVAASQSTLSFLRQQVDRWSNSNR